ncbi:SH3 domain-containing protein [Erythrobacter sp. YT30]|uniref:SH3 domain-containing protein n=1 Tax=Erythrobacter sp. YT30 TaxID=1735012 RepID=UPI000B2232D1|nr:SH3 domain-containing protein [Erythrobacter sp. YT30]
MSNAIDKTMIAPRFASLFVSALVALGLSLPALAQDNDATEWRSLRYEEVRMRVGPSQDYPIDWIYKRKGLPVKVIRKREAWSLVVDHEGTQGWVADSQLSKARGGMVKGEGVTELRAEPNANAQIRWRAEPGVVGKLGACQADWCEMEVDGRTGWVQRGRLWGVE